MRFSDLQYRVFCHWKHLMIQPFSSWGSAYYWELRPYFVSKCDFPPHERPNFYKYNRFQLICFLFCCYFLFLLRFWQKSLSCRRPFKRHCLHVPGPLHSYRFAYVAVSSYGLLRLWKCTHLALRCLNNHLACNEQHWSCTEHTSLSGLIKHLACTE